jgi:glycosyltransferase involved in cell wall biosynthesis
LEQLVAGSRFLRSFGGEINREIRSREAELTEYDHIHSYSMRAIPSIGKIARQNEVTTSITLNAYFGICPKNTLLYMGEENCESNGPVKCTTCVTESMLRETPRFDEPASKKMVRTPYRWLSKVRGVNRVFAGLEFKDDIDAFRAPSRHVLQNYEQFGFDTGKIHVIPHPVDEHFIVGHESDFSEPYNLLYVGALEDHKGVDRLVPIFEELQSITSKDYNLTIVGTGMTKSQIESQIRNSTVPAKIDLRGFIEYEELPQIYSNSDIFLYPGRWDEPFARVFLEALATGTPIVTTEFGDIQNMLGGGCRTTNSAPRVFAEKINRVTKGDTLSRMSTEASKRANKYDAPTIMKDIVQMYESIK